MPTAQKRRIADLQKQAELCFKESGITEYKAETIVLLSYCLGMSRTELYIHGDTIVGEQEYELFSQLVERRSRREPLAYISGEREFWSMDFMVTPEVLIPRPETEYLLEMALTHRNQQLPPGCILDLCCGSGVIGIVLVRELNRSVIATDISHGALAVALSNSRKHGVRDRLSFICMDLLSCFTEQPRFQLIVSNPPYVKAGDIAERLEPEVSQFEPNLALDGGTDGMDFITRIVRNVGKLLVPGGDCFLEVGSDQQREIDLLMDQEYCRQTYSILKTYKDYAQRLRVVHLRKR
ncbi:MAG: peptide chain release factor N(5)-glutamine methyltransferase [Desulfobulbaceae bacterium]|nr:MAG: peptide chain release factor N(5)-glutamine methyltransferase [Desulfobulbaceae bacterium]